MPTIHVPANWRVFTGGEKIFKTEAGTVDEALGLLVGQYPVLRQRIYNAVGTFASYVNIYVDDTNIRYGELGQTLLRPHSEVRIVPAVAGG